MGDAPEGGLAWNLRQLVELDQGFGVAFVARGGVGVPTEAAPVATAPRPATAIVAYATPRPVTSVAPAATATGLPATDLAAVAAEAATCRACGLCSKRKQAVPGEGDPAARLVFVGEGPGADEDALGRPFVGAAGQLLDAMIKGMGLVREHVYICNAIKCRPPGNRTPEPAEVAACLPFLLRQLRAIRPTVICTLGNTPLRALLKDQTLGITRLRGTRQEWEGIPLIPTFHPAYLLRNPDAKKPCWEDLKQVLAVLGREPPKR